MVPACRCEICREQVRIEEVQTTSLGAYHSYWPQFIVVEYAKIYLEAIRDDQIHLQLLIPAYCSTIMKRWCRSKVKREGYLATSQAIFPVRHAPLAVSFEGYSASVKQIRCGYLLPYLNAHALAEDPSKFLRILHHRAYSELALWVAFDNSQVQIGRRMGSIPERGAEDCTVMAGPDYAKVKSFDANEVHTGFLYCTPRDTLVLEA